ncbi:hypothetical protein ACIGFK_35910 [Streptomyces sp. NPDC085524]|uniref:hypothetical protein n=1 Tax=unclassified Streptomyces TaxID=2593676 RepID=UPI0035E33291
MSTLVTRIAKTAAAAVIAACALGAAHPFTTEEPPAARHSSASSVDFGSVTIPLDPAPQHKSDPTDVTWGH